MTAAQHKVLVAVKKLFGRLGHSPSYHEICFETGLRSLATVRKHLVNLSDQGYLLMGNNQSRSLVLIPNALGGFKKCELNHQTIFFFEGNCPLCTAIIGATKPREVLEVKRSP